MRTLYVRDGAPSGALDAALADTRAMSHQRLVVQHFDPPTCWRGQMERRARARPAGVAGRLRPARRACAHAPRYRHGRQPLLSFAPVRRRGHRRACSEHAPVHGPRRRRAGLRVQPRGLCSARRQRPTLPPARSAHRAECARARLSRRRRARGHRGSLSVRRAQAAVVSHGGAPAGADLGRRVRAHGPAFLLERRGHREPHGLPLHLSARRRSALRCGVDRMSQQQRRTGAGSPTSAGLRRGTLQGRAARPAGHSGARYAADCPHAASATCTMPCSPSTARCAKSGRSPPRASTSTASCAAASATRLRWRMSDAAAGATREVGEAGGASLCSGKTAQGEA